MVLIPVTAEKQNFQIQLGVSQLDLTIYFNERSAIWMMDLKDAITGTWIVAGAPLVLGQDILEPYIVGIGTIICFDTTQMHEEAGPDDLGTRVIVPFWTPAEVEAIVNE